MNDNSPRSQRSVPIGEYLSAFASERQAWLSLARNLIPVAGVTFFGWSPALTVFNYWLDGLAGLAALLAAVIARGVIESRRKLGAGAVRLVVGGLLIWAIVFGLFAMPYWFLLDSAKGVLSVGDIAMQVAQTPMLWIMFVGVVFGQFWRAFDGGYLAMPEALLKRRAQADFGALVARAIVMEEIVRLGLSAWLIPLMALALTYLEVWPGLQAVLLQRDHARRVAAARP
jgi:hypothetical protein